MKSSILSLKQIVAMLVGTVLYAALAIPFNVLEIPGSGGIIAIRPAVAIPMLFGFVFGPFTGFIAGFLGNVLSDTASFGGFSWNWAIGNGILGAISGIGYLIVKRKDWTKGRALLTSSVLAIVGSIVAGGFAAILDLAFQIGLSTLGAALVEFYSAAATDAVNGAILTPLLLFAYATATAGRARRV